MKLVLIFVCLFFVAGAVGASFFFLSPTSQVSPVPVPIVSVSPTPFPPSVTPSILGESSPSATPAKVKRTRKVKLVLFGDSMIHTMGDVKTLKNLLESSYTDLSVTIVNLGVGATTVEDGLRRAQNAIDGKPDIVVVESFAYNHLAKNDSGLSRHREVLGEIVSRLKAAGITKIIVLTTIAPLELYAKDASVSAGWSDTFRKEEADWIKRYLENALAFAHSSGVPFVDAYHKTLRANGYGNSSYVKAEDDIHPNEAGHEFVSRLLVEKIVQLGWLARE